jgi:hypothetical protein
MWVADSPMVVILPGLRRKAGLKQSPVLDGVNYGRVLLPQTSASEA